MQTEVGSPLFPPGGSLLGPPRPRFSCWGPVPRPVFPLCSGGWFPRVPPVVLVPCLFPPGAGPFPTLSLGPKSPYEEKQEGDSDLEGSPLPACAQVAQWTVRVLPGCPFIEGGAHKQLPGVTLVPAPGPPQAVHHKADVIGSGVGTRSTMCSLRGPADEIGVSPSVARLSARCRLMLSRSPGLR